MLGFCSKRVSGWGTLLRFPICTGSLPVTVLRLGLGLVEFVVGLVYLMSSVKSIYHSETLDFALVDVQ